MKLVKQDPITGVTLQYHKNNPIPFRVGQATGEGYWYEDLDEALDRFDKELAPKEPKTQPALDLDNPPEGLQTQTGRAARVLGKLDNYGDFPYVIAIHDGKQEHTYLANRSGKVNTLETSRKQLTTGPVKKEGWINLFRHPSRLAKTGCVYETRGEAILAASYNRLATIKITWEE